jgi:hypothetical protein
MMPALVGNRTLNSRTLVFMAVIFNQTGWSKLLNLGPIGKVLPSSPKAPRSALAIKGYFGFPMNQAH